MVVLSLEAYPKLTDGVEAELDKDDHLAEKDSKRMRREGAYGSLSFLMQR